MTGLGQKLFFDKDLSLASSVSCASCHDPDAWFIDSRTPNNVSASATGFTKRNSISLVNVAIKNDLAPADAHAVFTWIGAYDSPGAVLDLALTKAMGSTRDALVQTITAKYGAEFTAVFGVLPTTADAVFDRTTLLFDAYMRKLVSRDAPFDRYLAGDDGAVDASVKRGFAVFVGRGLCADCHRGPLFTDFALHTTGVPQTGVHVVPDAGNAGAFVTPGLRNVAQTGPYMHDGALATLADVVAFYRRGGDDSATPKDPRIVPLDISDADADDLVAFLRC